MRESSLGPSVYEACVESSSSRRTSTATCFAGRCLNLVPRQAPIDPGQSQAVPSCAESLQIDDLPGQRQARTAKGIRRRMRCERFPSERRAVAVGPSCSWRPGVMMTKNSVNQNVTYPVIHRGARSTIESLLDNEHDSSSRRGGGIFRVAGYIKYSGPGEPARALREKRDAHRTGARHRLG